MRYTTLGKSGLLVSSYSLGTSGFGTAERGTPGTFDEGQARELVAKAQAHGINFLDTADFYGLGVSEEVLGRALGSKRGDFVVATKSGLRVGREVNDAGLSRRHLIASVDASLSRLGTDWIDVYILHRTDPVTPLEETLSALDDIVRAGKVRYVGYSNWPAWLAAKAVGLQRQHGWSPFVVAQMYYSLAGRGLEFDTIPFALDAGIGIMAWSPLANGYLTGKYTDEDPTGGGGRRSRFTMGPFDYEHGRRIVEALRDIAARHASTPSRVALAWLSQRPCVSSIMLGLSRAEQLDDNLAALEIALSAEDLAALDAVSAVPEPYPNWYNTLMADDGAADALDGRFDRTEVRFGRAAYTKFYAPVPKPSGKPDADR